MEEIRLDKLDFRLLSELDRDCRQSIQQLARKLKTSRDIVSYRIRRLEQLKVIEGYYTLIDASRLGYILCRLYLKFRATTAETEWQLIEYLVAE
ncbi:MAG: AsnC family transcriptional regulator, partial [Nanoarchaeota archaeon]